MRLRLSLPESSRFPEGSSRSLIVGLGNPGAAYEMTRHNLGFLVCRAFASKHGLSFKRGWRLKGRVAEADFKGTKLILLMPTTYMNLSGEAVSKAIRLFKVPLNRLLVLVDDVYVPFDAMRFRSAGGTGGHNGLKSIQNSLHTQNYPRLRLGVGKGGSGVSDEGALPLENYVLSRFNSEESRKLPAFIERALLVVEEWLMRGDMAASVLAGNLSQVN